MKRVTMRHRAKTLAFYLKLWRLHMAAQDQINAVVTQLEAAKAAIDAAVVPAQVDVSALTTAATALEASITAFVAKLAPTA